MIELSDYRKDLAYAAGVVENAWAMILMEDSRFKRAAALLLMDVIDRDRTIEANLLADVAESHYATPEEMQNALSVHMKVING